MQGLKVGHVTLAVEGTGVTVFLFEAGAVGAYVLCGSAPASHELSPLDLDTTVTLLHGLVFTGGSAFGLQAASGVMRYLAEKNVGVQVPHGVVPIVPAVAIYDLAYKQAIPPTAEHAYQACLIASEHNQQVGRLGAGTGATVGKALQGAHCMTGGIGFTEIKLSAQVSIWAYAVVNASGDVRNAQQEIIAGACQVDNQQKTFLNIQQTLLKDARVQDQFMAPNTTLVCVVTNAKFNQAELKQIAKMAVAGFGNAIAPALTLYDGDIVFAISVGTEVASTYVVGTAAAEATAQAIRVAVQDSEIIF